MGCPGGAEKSSGRSSLRGSVRSELAVEVVGRRREAFAVCHGEYDIDGGVKMVLSPPEPAADGKARIDSFLSSFACAEE